MKRRLALKSGAVIAVLLMLPNLAWMLFHSLDLERAGSTVVLIGMARALAVGSVDVQRRPVFRRASSVGVVPHSPVTMLLVLRRIPGMPSGETHRPCGAHAR